MAERDKLDLTDRELYSLALAMKSQLISRETWMSRGNATVFNSLIKKVCENGMKRKDPESILHPIMEFKEEGDEEVYI